MTQLIDIDWDMVKFQYECLGYELAELQQEYNISDALLKYQARNWKRLPIEIRNQLDFPKISDYGEFSEALLEKVRREIDSVSLVKQKGLYTLYVELERTLLLKALKISRTLKDDETSISAVRNLLGIIHKMADRNPLINPQVEDVETQPTGPQKVTVEFTNANTDAEQTKTVSGEKEAV